MAKLVTYNERVEVVSSDKRCRNAQVAYAVALAIGRELRLHRCVHNFSCSNNSGQLHYEGYVHGTLIEYRLCLHPVISQHLTMICVHCTKIMQFEQVYGTISYWKSSNGITNGRWTTGIYWQTPAT